MWHKRLFLIFVLSGLLSSTHAEFILDPAGQPGYNMVLADSSCETIIVGIAGSGIWLSRDSGILWEPIDFGEYYGIINGGFIFDSNADTIILSGYSRNNQEVRYTTDNGITWNYIQNEYTGVGFNFSGPFVEYKVEDNTRWYYLNDRYLLSSDSLHAGWDIVWEDINQSQKECLYIDEENNNMYIISVYTYNEENPNMGVLKSTNNGYDWENIFEIGELYDIIWYGFRDMEIIADNRLIVCGTPLINDDTWDEGNVFITEDDGETWDRVYGGLPSRFMARQLLKSPDNDSLLFILGDQKFGLYRSTTGGTSWHRVLNGLPENVSYTSYMWTNPYSNDMYLAIRGGGAYKTSDDGNTWSQLPGPPIGPEGRLQVMDSTYYFRSISAQLWTKEAVDDEWYLLPIPTATDTNCLIGPVIYANNDTIIAYYYQRPFYNPVDYNYFVISEDGGENWEYYSELPFYPSNAYMWVHEINEETYVYASDMMEPNLWISDDYGISWQSHPLPWQESAPYRIDSGDSTLVMAGALDIYMSHSNGEEWTLLNHPGEEYLAWMATPVMIGDDNVYVSNSGLCWRWHEGEWTVQGAMPGDIETMIAVPRGSDTLLVGHDFSRIWFSENYGQDWHHLTEAFQYPTHSHKLSWITYDPLAEQLWISTSTGLQRLPINEVAVEEKEQSAQPSRSHIDVYPNPFNAVMTIEYSVPNKKTPEITIYNIEGKVVEKLESINSTDKISVNTDNWSSGMYLVVMKTDNAIETRKVVLVK